MEIDESLNDTAIRAVVRPRLPPGPRAMRQAAYGATNLEQERRDTYADWERERIALDGFQLDRPYKEPME